MKVKANSCPRLCVLLLCGDFLSIAKHFRRPHWNSRWPHARSIPQGWKTASCRVNCFIIYFQILIQHPVLVDFPFILTSSTVLFFTVPLVIYYIFFSFLFRWKHLLSAYQELQWCCEGVNGPVDPEPRSINGIRNKFSRGDGSRKKPWHHLRRGAALEKSAGTIKTQFHLQTLTPAD